MVLDLILKYNSGDKFIETNREKLFQSPSWDGQDLSNKPSKGKVVNAVDMMAEDIDIVDLGLG